MSIPEETLMAYVDGELGPAERSALEAVMRDDPQVAQRVAHHRELRAKIQHAYAAELTEPLPARLLAAVGPAAHPPPGQRPSDLRPVDANIVDLAQARAAAAAAAGRRVRPQWRALASMAASVMIGAVAGYSLRHPSDSILIQRAGGALVAGGALDRGLSNQLAGDHPPGAPLQVGLSFVAKSGDYCRTFSLSDASGAGLACRHGRRWEIRLLTQADSTSAAAPTGASAYRTAGTALPPAVRAAVQDQISGEPLDRNAEMAARKRGWNASESDHAAK